MALLFLDGFDHYGPVGMNGNALRQGVYAETNLGPSSGVIPTNPRTGTYALRFHAGANDAGVRRVLVDGAEATVGAGFAFYLNQLPTDNRSLGLLQWRNGSNQIKASVWITSTGTVVVVNGGRSGAAVAESEPVVYAGAYQHFEAVNGPAGIEVRINGVTVVNAPPVSAVAGDTAQIKLGANSYPLTGASGVYIDVDDFFIWSGAGLINNDFVGDVKIYTRTPTSDGPEQGWTPAAGEDGYANIDNIPPQDATEYVSAPALGSPPEPIRSTFGIGDFPEEIVAVRGVALFTRMWKTDAGNAKVNTGVQVDAAEETGKEWPLSMAPVWYQDVYEVNPATATVWSLGAINDMDTVIDRVE